MSNFILQSTEKFVVKNKTEKKLYVSVGGFAGEMNGSGDNNTFENCNVSGIDFTLENNPTYYAGGFYGKNSGHDVTYTNCSVSGKIATIGPGASFDSAIGGFVGWNAYYKGNKTYKLCTADVTVTTAGTAGGFSAKDENYDDKHQIEPRNAEYEKCTANGNVTGATAGAFVGKFINKPGATVSIVDCNANNTVNQADGYPFIGHFDCSGTHIALIYNANTPIEHIAFEKPENGSATFTVTDKKPTCEGYTFLGRGMTKNATVPDAPATLTTTTEITLYAIWEKLTPEMEPELPSGVLAAIAGSNPFRDVAGGAYYNEAVRWAAKNGIASGTDAKHFSPDVACTRGRAVTFLWRAAGCPAPALAENPFTEVKPTDYCYDAVLWAVQTGVAKGTSASTFSPDAACTRGQIVTFLYRAAGSPSGYANSGYTDVPETSYCAAPVAWAVTLRVTSGTSAITFSPDALCTRAQIVTFLYRANA